MGHSVRRAVFRGTSAALGLVCLFLLGGASAVTMSQRPAPSSSLESVGAAIVLGRCAEAEEEAARLVRAIDAAQTSQAAQAVNLLVEAQVCAGKGATLQTRELAETAVRDGNARLGPQHAIVAASFRNLGDVLLQAGDYGPARTSYERARDIHEHVLGGGHPDVADDLDRLVRILTLTEKYDDALVASDRALEIKERTLDGNDLRIAASLDARAALLQLRADFARARPALERALAIRETRYPSHPETARTLSLLAEQLRFEGDLAQAKQFAARAVSLAEAGLRPDHPDLASYLRILAVSVADLGDLSGARLLRERALALAERAFGPDHPAVAVQLNDLANTQVLEGQYSLARPLYERALRIYERRLGPDDSGVTTAVYNLAIVSASLGDSAEARRLFVRAIATWERVFGPDHLFVARAVTALAKMLSEQGRDREAQPLYKRALAIRERTLGRYHRDVALTLTAMATSEAKLGQVRSAYELSTRALDIWERAEALETRGAAETLTVQGDLHVRLGQYAAARDAFDRSLFILRGILGPVHPDVAEVQVPLAVAQASLGQSSDALGSALEAEQIGRDHLRLMLRHLPERQGLEYAAKRPKGLDFAMSIASEGDDGQRRVRAVDALIRSRALVLDETAERRHLGEDALRRDLAPTWGALVSARQRFANLVIRGPSERQRPESYEALVREAAREKEAAEATLAEKSAAFRAELARAEVGLEGIRLALPANSALIGLARYERTMFDSGPTAHSPGAGRPRATTTPSFIAFVIRSDDADISVVRLGSAAVIDALVAQWRQEITGILRSTSPSEGEAAYRTAGVALRQRVWDPLRKHLAGVSMVFVVPDGSLNLVSFEALPAGESGYLVERGPVIHYLSAERDLVTDSASSAATGGLLAVGGPAFDDASSFSRPTQGRSPVTPSATTPSVTASLRSTCGTLRSARFEPLAGTGREARQVAALWKDSPADILEGRAASERAFKREAPGRRVIHLATHGFFLNEACSSGAAGTRSVGGLAVATKRTSATGLSDNPLLLSGLALAGANRRASAGPDDEDGILTAEEVTALNLSGVEWAVLSACDTGLGEVKAGEGVFGLRRAFQVAGVRTVIMSLWSVDDDAARLWMNALYRNRLQRRMNTADAMHAASLSLLRDRRARGQSTHPFYWAAFVAAGDWR